MSSDYFMTVLREGELMEDDSLDSLKGGDCKLFICPCYGGGTYCKKNGGGLPTE